MKIKLCFHEKLASAWLKNGSVWCIYVYTWEALHKICMKIVCHVSMSTVFVGVNADFGHRFPTVNMILAVCVNDNGEAPLFQGERIFPHETYCFLYFLTKCSPRHR